MADREKVIKGLEFCTQHGSMCGSDCDGHYERYTDDGYVIKLVNEYRSKCPYGKCETGCVKTLAKDALALLKEQPEIVRCEDCKHRPTYPEAYGAEINGRWCYWCELLMAWKPDDWFCANGKRR